MRRFWIDRSCLTKEGEFVIKGSLYRHIRQVCKIKKGGRFELYCEGAQKYQVFLKSVQGAEARAKILKAEPAAALKKPYLHLALSIPRLSKMDFIIEKAVEMGVKELHPFISDFSFFKKASKITPERQKRWKKIAEHSLAQSGRTEAFILRPPCFLEEISIPSKNKAFLAYEGESGLPFLSKRVRAAAAAPEAVWLFIGSEGGFSPKEAENFSLRKNCFVFSMGDQILKVDTACLFGLSLLKYHYHFSQ